MRMKKYFVCMSLFVYFSEFKLYGNAVKFPGHGRPFGEHLSPMGVPLIGKFSSPQVFYGHFVRTNKPIHMKSALQETKHPGLDWTDEYLRKHFGLEMVRVEVGKKEVRDRRAEWMRLNSFLDDYPHKDLYMVHSITDSMKELVHIPKTLQCGGFERSLTEAVLWMGKGPLRSVLHYDDLDNLLCVFEGVKDVILIDQFYKKEVESRGFDQKGRFSMVDPESVDMYSFPQFQNMPWYRVHLAAGDCIYIPYRWYHQVTSFGERNLAMNIWFSHLWWFHDETCLNVDAFPAFQSLDAYGGFASSNEVLRSQWLENFLGADDDVDLQGFSERVSSGTKEQREKLFSKIDRDSDGLLSWEELSLFDINRAVLEYSDVFFPASSEENSSKSEDTGDAQDIKTTASGNGTVLTTAEHGKSVENQSETSSQKKRHTKHEEL